jgi:hypothetical protein
LGAIADLAWDCRVFHQLVEICCIAICIFLITIMRKLGGQLKAGGKRDATVMTATIAQKGLLCAAVTTFAVDVFVSSLAVQVLKLVCWAGILADGLYHFMRYNLDLKASFRFASKANVRTAALLSAIRTRKKLKASMQINFAVVCMQINFAVVCLFVAMYIWYPEGSDDGFRCGPRLGNATTFTARTAIGSAGAVMAHINILHSIWVFKKKKKKRQGAQAAISSLDDVQSRSCWTKVVQAPATIASAVFVCLDPTLLERKGHATIRSTHFYRLFFAAFLSLVVAADICLPLFVTGEASFEEAKVHTC